MNEIAVIYKSHYGSSRQYAQWIAEATGAKLFSHEDANLDDLADCGTIVYVGGLYVGGIAGFSWIKRHYEELSDRNLLVVAVGSSSLTNELRRKVTNQNLTSLMIKNKVRLFMLRGAVDYNRMNASHRLMMKALATSIKRKSSDKRTGDEQAILDGYGSKKVISHLSRENVEPITTWILNHKESEVMVGVH